MKALSVGFFNPWVLLEELLKFMRLHPAFSNSARWRLCESRIIQVEDMPKQSAGLLLYRFRKNHLEVLLVHPGGPFWAKKDLGSWSIPKGEFSEGEEALAAAQREFQEETGFSINGEFKPLSSVKQKSGKIVYAWAIESDIDHTKIKSNTFKLEWPPKSGKINEFPEIDRAEWFTIAFAREKINPGQIDFLDRLVQLLTVSNGQ